MSKHVLNAECRFCGQMVQFESDSKLSYPQAEEEATMLCQCFEAVKYQKESKRREKALKNISVLFGDDAASDKRIGDDIVGLLKAAVEQIYSGELAKITLNMRGGVKASITQNSKGEINVERTETKKEKLGG